MRAIVAIISINRANRVQFYGATFKELKINSSSCPATASPVSFFLIGIGALRGELRTLLKVGNPAFAELD
jgi:hypothetical protein